MSARNSVDIYLIGGQSNADGRIPLHDAPRWFNQHNKEIPHCYMWERGEQKFKTWKFGRGSRFRSGAWRRNEELFAFDMICMQGLQKYLDREIYLVKCTKGDTSLTPVNNPAGTWSTDLAADANPKMFYELRNRIFEVRNHLAAEGKTANFKGMIWHQGESDSQTKEKIESYEHQMHDLLNATRKYTWNNDLWLVMGTISKLSVDYRPALRERMESFVANHNKVFLYDVGESPLLDSCHFNAEAAKNIGQGYLDIITDNKLY
jgi:hypothetical protein